MNKKKTSTLITRNKIVFFIGTLCNGGAERVVSILSSYLAKHEWDVDILMYYDEPIYYEVDKRIRIISLTKETNSKNLITNISWMRQYFKENACIVISFLTKFNILAIVAMIGIRIPIIVSERSDPKKSQSSLLKLIRNLTYYRADAIVVQSQYAKNCLRKRVHEKTEIIYNPIDVNKYFKKRLLICKKKEIVSVGRLIPSKNYTMLIEAFSNVVSSLPNYKLIIYGEGECREQLEKQIAELRLQNKVFLPGNTKDVFEKMVYSDMFILASNYEGFSNSLLEAMCMGLPVISTKVAGSTEIIRNNENGILIDVGNKEQLIDSIKILANDKEKKEQLGEKAADVVRLVNTERIYERWISLINRVLLSNKD